ncbi:TetR family transcriptional regulator, partial [Amycolatopsis alba DSM 44262]
GEVDDVPVDVTARLLFGALSSAAIEIASSPEPKKVSAQVEEVLVRLLVGFRRVPAAEHGKAS